MTHEPPTLIPELIYGERKFCEPLAAIASKGARNTSPIASEQKLALKKVFFFSLLREQIELFVMV